MTLRQPNIERMLQLGLNGMAEAMDDLQELADSGELGFDDRLAMLLERELAHRNQRSYRAHLRRAQLRVQADLQDVNCREGRGISRTLLTQLGTGDWIRNAHVFPARAGMTQLLPGRDRSIAGVPRPCGDEPGMYSDGTGESITIAAC